MDGKETVGKVAVHRSKVDARDDDATPKGKYGEVAVRVEPSTDITIARDGSAQTV